MPTFSFPTAPQYLTVLILRDWNAPLPVPPKAEIHSFGNMLDARLFSTHNRSTSELLRTL
jgi:hypothetical protein